MMSTNDRPLKSVLRDVADDIRDLLRGELALARAEAGDKMDRVIVAVVSIFGGILLGFSALNILLIALVQALSNVMPVWLASILVGAAVALVGFLLVRQGQQALTLDKLTPNRTAANVSADARVVKEHVT
jgi:hypothetical protein